MYQNVLDSLLTPSFFPQLSVLAGLQQPGETVPHLGPAQAPGGGRLLSPPPPSAVPGRGAPGSGPPHPRHPLQRVLLPATGRLVARQQDCHRLPLLPGQLRFLLHKML